MMFVVLLVVKVSEKWPVDLEGSHEGVAEKLVGKTGGLRDVVAHSVGLGFREGHPSWMSKHR